jgi:hypothetical protein
VAIGYIDPYPPGYMFVMGLLAQTSGSIYYTLKIFNALIISLGILFFYFMAVRFIGSEKKAFYAAFILFAIPCFVSHFIWSHSFVPIILIVAVYCLERLEEDKLWLIPSISVIAASTFIAPTGMIKIAILLSIYVIVKSILKRKIIWPYIYAALGGIAISLIWWGRMVAKMFSQAKVGASEKEKWFLNKVKEAVPVLKS